MTIALRDNEISWAPLAAALGCGALLLRPVLWDASSHPLAVTVALFIAVLLVGACWPVRAHGPTRMSVTAALVLGFAAFMTGRVVGGGQPPGPFALHLLLLNSLAAVAEEAFFRRLVFAVLEPAGAVVAVIGSAALFALVHITVYGTWVLPIDLTAGLLLSWQRYTTGSWAVPAVTHVLANVLVVY